MMNCNAPNQSTPRMLLISFAAALTTMITVSLPQPTNADDFTPPPVPSNIQVPAGNMAYLKGHAVGTQNYICLPAASGFAWTLFGPQATLFNDNRDQVITHFLSPNPAENGTPRATWQHSGDTSADWGVAMQSSSDPAFVASDAIPWLLLQVVGAQMGPNGGSSLADTTFIQRLNTVKGVAPSTGCAASTDVGKRALVPYTADYYFFKAAY